MSTSLVLHKGARPASLEEVAAIAAPPSQGRWFPLSHGLVLQRVVSTLAEAGFLVRRQQLALSRGDARFFGVLDLSSTLANGVTLSVGVRNSVDKSFPIGFCAGSRVFCCDNLAFSAELLVRRKHTRFGEQRFQNDIAASVVKLGQFQTVEASRIKLLQDRYVSEANADSIILKAFEKGIVSSLMLPAVIREWRKPSFEEFEPRTYWSLFNAFTTAMGDRLKTDPQKYSLTTMRLSSFVSSSVSAQPLAA